MLELDLEVLELSQGLGLEPQLASGQLEEPWELLPLLEPSASQELCKLDYHRTL